MSALALARLPVARLVRTRRGVIAVAWWTVFALGAVLVARGEHAASADVALLSVYVPFVQPLIAFAIVGAVLGGEGLGPAIAPLTRFGASRFASALAAGLVATLASALVCTALAVALLASAHNAADPPLAHDLSLTAYVAALAGGAHGAFFVLGSAFGARGGGRGFALLVDWVLGTSPGWLSAIVPYAHARSLLGGAPVVTLAQRDSAWCLVAITAASLVLASLRFSVRRR